MATYTFRLDLEVQDKDALYRAACEKAIAEGNTTEHLDSDGEISITDCLVTLLDPGTLPGCEIFQSTAD